MLTEHDVTAISSIEQQQGGTEIYDIAGRRLRQPHKGLNIINGRKVEE